MNDAIPFYGAVVIMGVSGCGKTTVGRLLAAQLACPFIEGDELHDAGSIVKMQSGRPLTDDDRWLWLDRVGQALRVAIADYGSAVAACSALKQIYRNRLRHALSMPIAFVLLDVSYQSALARMDTRAAHFMPSILLASQFETLERPTSFEKSLTLDGDLPPATICESIQHWLKSAARST